MERDRRNPKHLSSASLGIDPDGASRLVGSILEKGVPHVNPFSPIPPPTPTVLPFPVARHRSHGPHWSPAGSKGSGKDDPVQGYRDDDEEEQFSDANSIAAFAKPVQRKKKQELEFRRWKELLSGDDSGSPRKVATSVNEPSKFENQSENRQTIGKKVPPDSSFTSLETATSMEMDDEHNAPTEKSESHTEWSMARLDMELNHPLLVAVTETNNTEDIMRAEFTNSPMRGERISHDGTAEACFHSSSASTMTSSRLNELGSRQMSSSLESEIDAENRVLLQKMSPEEIAEAQTELIEKMDPALLNLLKKRGLDKLKKQRHSVLAASTADRDINHVKTKSQFISPDGHPWQSESGTSSASNVTANPKESNAVQSSRTIQGILWDTWSQRVEAVRDLRFSLDGDVVIEDIVLTTEAGNKWSNCESAAERDFLRTEGEPGAAGYTIKEAIALARSAVPGQRSLALHLLASVLDKALYNICQSRISCMRKNEVKANKSTDWEAVWAYALGPEPELVLAVRMALDDNHNSVILACVRVILCLLCCDRNENFFEVSEKMAIHGKDIFTAPVFRSKPEIDLGFLHGGYWKYSAKPSNIFPSHEEISDDGTEDTGTIQDDVYVAGQDIAAGLVRMGILPRIYFLLETEPTTVLEESIISILIAIARHSPTCTNAVLKYPKLVETVVKSFSLNKRMEVLPSQIKTVRFLKVLSRFDQRTCVEIVKNRTLDVVTWHLFQFTPLDSWVKLGKDNCKLSSALMVEQLQLWKVCIQKGCCISRFAELFPALCLWLSCPSFDNLIENNLICEFASVSKEAYLFLEALAGTLPNIYSHNSQANNSEAWKWSYVNPMIDTALSWIMSVSKLVEQKRAMGSSSVLITSLLWVFSAVMHTISKVLEKVTANGEGEPLPWLPEFVPKIGLAIINLRLLSFCVVDDSRYARDSYGCSSFVESLCYLRQQCNDEELSLASVSCLHGIIQTVASIQYLIQFARSGMKILPQKCISSRDESVLAEGILTESLAEIRAVWNVFRDLIASEWSLVQSVEVHKRGGPAPGVGLGWGATGGGFWSTRILLAQADAYFLSLLFNISPVDSVMNSSEDRELAVMMEKLNSGLAVSLIAGPRDHILVEKTLDFVLQPHALELFSHCVKSNKRFGEIEWEYTEENYIRMNNVLASHYKHRWLQQKKSKADNGDPMPQEPMAGLETIHEDSEMSDYSVEDRKSESLVVEWVHQRLPLAPHWFLSAISGACSDKTSPGLPESMDFLEVTKAGIFLLAGLESLSCLASQPCPIVSVPLVWKFHALSAALLVGMDFLEDKTTGNLYESLQELYGQLLDEARSNGCQTELLRFKSDIHDNYSVFLETLVEQYAAVSYGDILYGRQVSIYLHQCVEPSVRLAAWTVLSNARVLDLLPSVEKCLGRAEGYLEPVEEDEAVLEAYLKTWICGGLDRAASRGSVAFTLVLHHFSSLIFGNEAVEKVPLRNKIVNSLLRDYSKQQQPKREGMMLNLLRYDKWTRNGAESSMTHEERFEVLKEACQGNSSLLSHLDKLKSVLSQTTYGS
ncbi:PREDICTED: transcriptional elongation regulator MINIYO [Tarenaya hassleriana]|uniref:transcriptional elongation regulator MINIYO n=1 Tax=Tarenaya hassleriana TaxID=28532 RepID=UPI00053C870D|nr:PREDICTED: transcriptional elongation regulator MINIYO [Tarenaya hassleriana]